MQAARGANRRVAPGLRMLAMAIWLPLACAAADPPAGAPESLTALRGLISDAACDDDSHCRTVAIGAKACGGPEAYLAWSVKRTDAALLEAAAARYAAARRKEIAGTGMQSDCALVTDPGAYCAPVGVPQPGAADGAVRACRLRASRRGAGVAPY